MPEEMEKDGVPGTPKEFVIFGAIVVIIGALSYWLLKNTFQTLAATIFMAMVVGTLMFWRFRVAIAFAGIVLLLITRTTDLKNTIKFMNLDVIIFLVGMMIVVGLLRETGFFRWLGIKVVKLAKFEPRRMMVFILFLAALMAALVDEVTSILFMTALIFELCDHYRVKPVNYVISVVLATNIGSSWTVLGNPIGILIALRAGLTFEDFIRWAFPVSFIGLLSLIPIILIWQRKDLRELESKMEAKLERNSAHLDEWSEVRDRAFFRWGIALFLGVIIFLAMHYRLELMLDLEKNTLLVATSITGAAIVMFWKRAKAREYLEKHVDWWSLTFFMFLFAMAGTLHYTGLTGRIADSLIGITLAPVLLTLIITTAATFSSAALDNVVAIAALIPVVHSIAEAGVYSFPLWWALLFGGTYGGNITMVGSTANIIALGMLEKRTGYYMTLRKWILIGLAGGLLPLIVAKSLLLVQLPFMP